MAIVFSASLNAQQVEQTLRSLPNKAQEAGRKMGENLGRAAQAASSSTRDYVNDMKRRIAEAMNAGSGQGDSARQRQRARDQAENARAQAQMDRDAERKQKQQAQADQRAERDAATRARKAESEDRRMDDARARTRAQTRRRVEELVERDLERVRQERQEKSARQRGRALALGTGIFIGHQLVQSAIEYGEALNRIQVEMGGITAEQGKQMALWRQMASAAHTREQGLELRAQMAGDIQSEMERYRNESTDQGALENISDWMSGLFGGQTFMQQRNEAFASRVGAMEAAARSNMRIAANRQAFIDTTRGLNPGEQEAILQNKIGSLRGEMAGLNPDDPGQLRHIQRLQAEIKSLEPLRDKNRARMLQERDAARDMLTITGRQKKLEEERADVQKRIEDSNTPQHERELLEDRLQQIRMQTQALDIQQFERAFGVGMMGAGGRRDAFRSLRREQREINRINRLGEKGIKDARAFSDRLIDPQIGREAEIARMGMTMIVNIDRNIADIKNALRNPVTKS